MQLGAVDTHLLLRNDEGAFYMPTPHRLPRLLALAPAPTALSPTASAIEVHYSVLPLPSLPPLSRTASAKKRFLGGTPYLGCYLPSSS